MTEIEKIFNSKFDCYADTRERIEGSDEFKDGPLVMAMTFEAFTQALAEVFELVKVTDEEIELIAINEKRAKNTFKVAAKWSRDHQQNKLEKLLKA